MELYKNGCLSSDSGEESVLLGGYHYNSFYFTGYWKEGVTRIQANAYSVPVGKKLLITSIYTTSYAETNFNGAFALGYSDVGIGPDVSAAPVGTNVGVLGWPDGYTGYPTDPSIGWHKSSGYEYSSYTREAFASMGPLGEIPASMYPYSRGYTAGYVTHTYISGILLPA